MIKIYGEEITDEKVKIILVLVVILVILVHSWDERHERGAGVCESHRRPGPELAQRFSRCGEIWDGADAQLGNTGQARAPTALGGPRAHFLMIGSNLRAVHLYRWAVPSLVICCLLLRLSLLPLVGHPCAFIPVLLLVHDRQVGSTAWLIRHL